MAEDWRTRAVCLGGSSDWFPGVGRDGRRDQEAAARAVAACRKCPVRRDCAGSAIAVGAQAGIWAEVNLGYTGGRAMSNANRRRLEKIRDGAA